MFISYNIVLIFKYDLSFSIDRHTSYLKDFAYIIFFVVILTMILNIFENRTRYTFLFKLE